MTLFKPNGKTITINMDIHQIINMINDEFIGVTATLNADENADLVFDKEVGSEKYYKNLFNEIHEVFPEIWVKHANNGFSGSSFEFAMREKYAGQGFGV